MNLISAKSVKLELCTENNCYDYNDNPSINSNDSIILKIILINENSEYMCWRGIQYSFKYLSNNVGDYNSKGEKYVSGGYYGDDSRNLPFCFSNSNKIENEILIPLNEYNKLESAKRLGSWSISEFNLVFNGLTYYNNIPLTENSLGDLGNGGNSFNGNEIKFVVITNEPEKNWFGKIENEKMKLAIRGLNVLLGIIAAGIWVYIFTMDKRKKAPYLSATLFTIFFIILTILGFS